MEWTLAPKGSTEISMAAVGGLVSDGDPITVTLTVEASESDTNVTPTLLPPVGTNGAGATCTGPLPASLPALVADTPVDFVWTCMASAGATPGKLTFEAGVSSDKTQTNPVGMVYANAIANTVLVSPPLTFQVVVDDDDDLPYGLTAITNTAQAQSEGTAPTFATVNDLLEVPPPVAEDDSSSGNTPGDPVTLNILTNDALGSGTTPAPRRCHRGAGSNQRTRRRAQR